MGSLDNMKSELLTIILHLGAAIAILIVGRWLARVSRRWMRKILVKTTLTPTLIDLSLKITYYGVLGMAILLAMSAIGIQTTTLIAAVGIVVLVLGIALQASIANFAATVIFLLFEPFSVGDVVETGGVTGTVNELQIFNTVLYKFDGKVVTLPNAKIQSDGVTNYSKLPNLRVDLEIGISYQDDLAKAKQTAHDIVTADPRVLPDPPVQIVVLELDESSVNLGIRPFVEGKDYWAVKWDLTEKIKLGFDEAGITIPFPQTDVHLLPMPSEQK